MSWKEKETKPIQPIGCADFPAGSNSNNMEPLETETLVRLASYLDLGSLARFLQTSKTIWKLRGFTKYGHFVPLAKYANSNNWNSGLCYAVLVEEEYRFEFIAFFMNKGATAVNHGLLTAVQLGDKAVAEFFIQQGATCLNLALRTSVLNGKQDMVEFLVNKGATNWDASCMLVAARRDVDMCNKMKQSQQTPWVSQISKLEEGHKKFLPNMSKSMSYNHYFF